MVTHAEHQRLRRAPDDLASWLEMDEDVELAIDPVGLGIVAAEL